MSWKPSRGGACISHDIQKKTLGLNHFRFLCKLPILFFFLNTHWNQTSCPLSWVKLISAHLRCLCQFLCSFEFSQWRKQIPAPVTHKKTISLFWGYCQINFCFSVCAPVLRWNGIDGGRKALGESLRHAVHVAHRQPSGRERVRQEHGANQPWSRRDSHPARHQRGLDFQPVSTFTNCKHVCSKGEITNYIEKCSCCLCGLHTHTRPCGSLELWWTSPTMRFRWW